MSETSDVVCTCDIPQMHTRTCFICKLDFHIQMDRAFRKMNCAVSGHIFFAPCGYPDYVCVGCENEGWHSLTGDGGGIRCHNKLTDEYMYLPEPFISSESEYSSDD